VRAVSTKVLVVDDSALMRRLLGSLLGEAGFEVRIARNGLEGVRMLTDWEPDVVTLDVNMPEMDGLTALALIMQARPTPVVMVSSLTERGTQATLEALALGAVDFIAKPGGTISLSVDEIRPVLIEKVRAAARARLRSARPAWRPHVAPLAAARRVAEPAMAGDAAEGPPSRPPVQADAPAGLVLIGVSTGGPRTLEDVLPALPADFPWPVVVAQHMPVNFTAAFARRLDGLCALRVREVQGTVPLQPGEVYVAQGGQDVVLAERLGRVVLQTRAESPAHLWHPSVELLVGSALRCMEARRLVAVMLTGMGDDGARAMAELRRQGGRTIAEDERTAIVHGMPGALIALGGASRVLPSDAVAQQLRDWAAEPLGAR
jgi:two-component system chemotaxis response regulator CheB